MMIIIIMQGNPADELARHGEIVESLQSFSQARSINSRAVNSGGWSNFMIGVRDYKFVVYKFII